MTQTMTTQTMTKSRKAALFTDIHFGRKNNSEQHNQDCLDYLNWFCDNVRADPEIDCVFFLGDWHQHRSSINGLTLKYSTTGAKLLNELGLPVYMIVGNHDLYNRNNRDVYTTTIFNEHENIIMVFDKPVVLEANNAVIFPFLFEHEYHTVLPQYGNYDVIFGHFEFQGFVVTGDYKTLDHGPDHTTLSKPKRIFTGHFHKRQTKDNVHYIGNAFPADYSDANDGERGMATYDFDKNELEFMDWSACPMYVKCNLSEVFQNPKKYLIKGARVKCLVDVELNFEESNALKEQFMKKYKLREVSLEESSELMDALEDTDISLEGMELETTENIIKEMLRQIKSEKINNDKLVKIYEGLKDES